MDEAAGSSSAVDPELLEWKERPREQVGATRGGGRVRDGSDVGR